MATLEVSASSIEFRQIEENLGEAMALPRHQLVEPSGERARGECLEMQKSVLRRVHDDMCIIRV